MYNLIKMEAYRLKHNKLFFVCAIASILLGVFTSRGYIENLTTRIDAVGIFEAMVYDSTIFLILFSTITAMFLGQDFSNRIISIEVSSGHSRPKIFFSKCLFAIIMLNIFMLLFPISGSIRMSFVLGWGNFSQNDIMYLLRVIGFSLLLNSATFSVCILAVFAFRDLAKSISVSFVVILIAALILAYGQPMGWYSSFSLLRFSPLNQIREILDYSISATGLIEAAASGIIWLMFFLTASFRTFLKCELK